jgi:hypothetical protein
MFAYVPGKNIKRWKCYESSTNEDVEDLSVFRIKKLQNTLKEKGSLTSFF